MFSEQLRATLKRCCQVNVHQPQLFLCVALGNALGIALGVALGALFVLGVAPIALKGRARGESIANIRCKYSL